MNRICIVGIPLSLLLVALLTAAAVTWYLPKHYRTNYGVIVDAGSTKSSVHVFQWDEKARHAGTANPAREVGRYCKTARGIGEYADPIAAAESIAPCLREAVAKIPEQLVIYTPIYIGATAGMRVVSAQNPQLADSMFVEIKNVIRRETKLVIKHVGIITGSEEAAFAWVSANYLMKRLAIGTKRRNTVGALDTGGASTQIAFESREANGAKNFRDLRIYGINYNTYAQSFLCYGTQQARKMYRALLVHDSGYRENVTDPCLPRGYSEELGGSEIFVRPCFDQWNTSYATLSHLTFTFNGASDPNGCFSSIKHQFNRTVCEKKPCSMNNVYLPKHNHVDFVASSGSYYYVAKRFGLLHRRNLSLFHEVASQHCAKTVNQTGTDPYELAYCFSGSYMYSLVTLLYGFDQESWKSVDIRKNINGTSVGWSFGYLLYQTGQLPAQDPSRPGIQLSSWVSLVIAVVITGLLVIVLLVAYYRKKMSG